MDICRSSASAAFLNFQSHAASFRGAIVRWLLPICALFGVGVYKLGSVTPERYR
jgi:hypothetical protein